MTRTLYLFCSAAPPVFEVAGAIEAAQSRGWDVCLGLTPTAAQWLADSLDGLAALTGHPVRYAYGMPGQPEPWPRADVMLFAPATFNSLNEWALGLTAKFTVGALAQGLGCGVPTVVVPCFDDAYARHPAFGTSVATLRTAGATVLYGTEADPRPEPGAFPWAAALDAVEGAPWVPGRI
ncbi:flavoprotein [Streptomyces sp. NPDC015131]|uniref:flavoprotein n=1 Tax=Streptomyces sp. NPDC015131 TaxID=3364941 RepID=UPI0036F70CF9